MYSALGSIFKIFSSQCLCCFASFFFLIMWVISFELISPTTIRLSIGLPNKLLVKDFMCSQGTSL